MWGFRGCLLLSLVLHCAAQNITDRLKALGCDEIKLTHEEQICFANFMADMMKKLSSLANSAGNSEGDPDVSATSIIAVKGVFEAVCKNNVCLNGIKKTYAACRV